MPFQPNWNLSKTKACTKQLFEAQAARWEVEQLKAAYAGLCHLGASESCYTAMKETAWETMRCSSFLD
eukprot:1517088-Amphidinium_carterae.1